MLPPLPRSAAAVDVVEEEPLADSSPLWGMENVVVQPGEGRGA